jgi:hypothetical protein
MVNKTPCGGVFSVIPTDVLAVGTSSNIGACGVVAAAIVFHGATAFPSMPTPPWCG